MQYGFILGRVYTLTLAELLAVLSKVDPEITIIDASKEAVIIESKNSLPVDSLQARLGGIIKIVKIVDLVTKREQDSVQFALQHYFRPSKLKSDYLKSYSGKIQFGISLYALHPALQLLAEPKRIGMTAKRILSEMGQGVRLVLPEYGSSQLSSVSVSKNQLLTKGAEICIFASQTKVYIGKTLSVQDFEDYGRRDYQRPVRDDRAGMMPPKVAQAMLNLAGLESNSVILDPFCGSGTILQEGALLGFRMVGTDNSAKAIAGSETNLEWFRNRYKISKSKFYIKQADARAVNEIIAQLVELKAIDKVSGIVTEGTLGPTYSHFPTQTEIQQNFTDLKELYRASYQEFLKFLPSGAVVVMCLPAYKKGKQSYEMLDSLDFLLDLGYTLKDLIPPNLVGKFPFIQETFRHSVIYDRKDQIVAREIVLLQRN